MNQAPTIYQTWGLDKSSPCNSSKVRAWWVKPQKL